MYINDEISNNILRISYFNKDGYTNFKKFRINSLKKWLRTVDRDVEKSNNYLSYDGDYVKRINSRGLNKFTRYEILNSLPDNDKEKIFSTNLPRMYFCDIETEVNEHSPKNMQEYIQQAINRITTIALVNPENVVYFFYTKDLKEEDKDNILNETNEYVKGIFGAEKGYKIKFFYFDSEKKMLSSFLKVIGKIPIPLLTGWNFLNFDWNYIVNRALNLDIDLSISSPVDIFNEYTNKPYHVFIEDYLDIYKKWDTKIEIKENFSLDYTASRVLGIKKVPYTGDLQELFINDFKKYSFYNIIDTILVQLIHRNIKTINIPLIISSISGVSVYKNSSPVAITQSFNFKEMLNKNMVVTDDVFDKTNIERLYVLNENSFYRLRNKLNLKILNKLLPIKNKAVTTETYFIELLETVLTDKEIRDHWDIIIDKTNSKYLGAYVKDPISGKYNYIIGFDFSSLYPTTIRQFNISFDSYLFKVLPSEITEYRKKGYIVCYNGAVFDSETSLTKETLTKLYQRRIKVKDKMKKSKNLYYKIDNLLKTL